MPSLRACDISFLIRFAYVRSRLARIYDGGHRAHPCGGPERYAAHVTQLFAGYAKGKINGF